MGLMLLMLSSALWVREDVRSPTDIQFCYTARLLTTDPQAL